MCFDTNTHEISTKIYNIKSELFMLDNLTDIFASYSLMNSSIFSITSDMIIIVLENDLIITYDYNIIMTSHGTLIKICLDERNINQLFEFIIGKISLSKNSYQKCKLMLYQSMSANVSKVEKIPTNETELVELIRAINKTAIDDVMNEIIKKNPQIFKQQNRQMSKEKMDRELETYGQRENHFSDRPYYPSKKGNKEYTEPEVRKSQWDGAYGSSLPYASAFSDNLITKGIAVQQDQAAPNYESMYQDFINQRGTIGQPQGKPETPDFSLDGSGEKVKREKMMKKMREAGMLEGNTPGFGPNQGQGFGDFNSMPLNNFNSQYDQNAINPQGQSWNSDPYASILGTPVQQTQGMNPMMGQGLNPMQMQGMNPMMGQGLNPMMGQGMNPMQMQGMNPMMGQGLNPMQMQGLNPMMGQGMNMSAKASQLQNDYEKKMAERSMIDVLTNQPRRAQTQTQQFGGVQPMQYNNQLPLNMMNY